MPLKVAIAGGGPAGLYLALLLKKADRGHRVTVLERNRPDDTFGWGVVFSDQTLGNLRAADLETYSRITEHFAHWDDIDIHYKGTTITSGGHGFCGISRKVLLQILQERAADLGVDLRFQCELADDRDLERLGLGDADLIVAADGANSAIRRRYADFFRPDLDIRSARYVWLGTTRLFDAFTFIFRETPAGVFQVHAYRFDRTHSAFIVECDEASWRKAGLDRQNASEAVAFSEELFAPWLDGHRLIHNAAHQSAAPWQRFVRVRNERWYHKNIVLIGDAAHTAHFSIGSGTKLAMEDAIGLARALGRVAGAAGTAPAAGGAGATGTAPAAGGAGAASTAPTASGAEIAGNTLTSALEAYQADRMTEALRLQNAARNSMEWFENVPRYMRLDPPQFAYSLLTRSQRVSHENLRLRDSRYLEGVERWFASRAEEMARAGPLAVGVSSGEAGASGLSPAPASGVSPAGAAPPGSGAPIRPVPPMFTPFRLRSLELVNRVVVSPMDMYSAEDGLPNDFHLVHLGSRALGGAGLIITEMTCVSREGRISPKCTGMYKPEHACAWYRIVDFVHRYSRAKIGLQLGHSGRKGSTKLMWEGMDEPLEDGNWPVMGPSPLPYSGGMQVPREMTRVDMDRVREEFVRATRGALEAGFDMIELHAAHGYLLSSFITPLSNRREDAYGGSLENRLRYPLEVLRAMRNEWPEDRPISVRISATDWVQGGLDGAEAVDVARAFHAAGADIIHVSTGQTSPEGKPVYGRMFQTPFSDRIRNETGLPTIAVGNITEADQVNGIIAAGRADLVALARPHLADPHWTLRAAAEQGYADQYWPPQYLTGKDQLERRLKREAEMRAAEDKP